MLLLDDMLTKISNIARYLFSGGVTFLINASIFLVLTEHLNVWYIYSAIIAFAASALAGYFLHKTITYSDKTPTSTGKVIHYYMLNIANVIMNALLLFIFVEYFSILKIIALVISNLLIAVYSYFIYKKIIFI